MKKNRLVETLEALGKLSYPWPRQGTPNEEYNRGFSDGFICAIKYSDKEKNNEINKQKEN